MVTPREQCRREFAPGARRNASRARAAAAPRRDRCGRGRPEYRAWPLSMLRPTLAALENQRLADLQINVGGASAAHDHHRSVEIEGKVHLANSGFRHRRAQSTISPIPWLASSRSWWAINGSPATWTSDFGAVSVSGRNRVANPPASKASAGRRSDEAEIAVSKAPTIRSNAKRRQGRHILNGSRHQRCPGGRR